MVETDSLGDEDGPAPSDEDHEDKKQDMVRSLRKWCSNVIQKPLAVASESDILQAVHINHLEHIGGGLVIGSRR